MNPGRELDTLVAEKVLEHTVKEYAITWDSGYTQTQLYLDEVYAGNEMPAYSTDIAAAWQVVERLTARGHSLGIKHEPLSQIAHLPPSPDDRVVPWKCWFNNASSQWVETAPHAICLAALAAVGASP